ncbi:MAG: hypothetical protein M0Q92_02225 [Methanoregula sp.]|jgi:hypothetical protein|nr:hypothetical protein [Methanoregula sp.]
METYLQNQKAAPVFSGMPAQRSISDERSLEECRTLLGILWRKTETLYRECEADRTKVTHLREMGAVLSSLAALVDTLNQGSCIRARPGILEDNYGNTYHSVRFCDMDRMSDK